MVSAKTSWVENAAWVNSILSLSAVYPYGDPRRIFAQGNQQQLWHLVSQV
jgi:hypothetical protein